MYIYIYFEDFVVYKYGVRLAARPPGVFRHQKYTFYRFYCVFYLCLCIFMYIYVYFEDFVVYKYGVRLAARPPGGFRHPKNAPFRDFLTYLSIFMYIYGCC